MDHEGWQGADCLWPVLLFTTQKFMPIEWTRNFESGGELVRDLVIGYFVCLGLSIFGDWSRRWVRREGLHRRKGSGLGILHFPRA